MSEFVLKGEWRDNALETLGGVREQPTACVVRYGGFGDMIMASSVLPGLKAQGYRVCVNTEPRGQDILKLDPHVDEWLIQEKNQVPATELREYWDHISPMFQKWVNLTGSVEGRCLAQGPRVQKVNGEDRIFPARPEYHLSHDERQARFSMNYLEETHAIADVPMPAKPHFYASLPETRAARILIEKHRKKSRVDTVVLWVLNGSSGHKLYPYMDDAIKLILTHRPRTGIVFVGDEAAQFLEQPWRDEPRILRRAGRLSIRETMALAQLVDCVVGPETGVLNAVSDHPVRKVVFLSHSSVQNLTRDWINTISLHNDTPCYPCHQLHLGIDECPQDVITRMPLCTALDAGVVARAVMKLPVESTDTQVVRSA